MILDYKIPYQIVDSHLHFHSFSMASDGFRKLISEMDSAGVEKSVLFGSSLIKTWDNTVDIQPLRYTDNSDPLYYFSATDYILLEELEKQPDDIKNRFYPFICGFNPNDKNSIEYIKKILKLHPNTIAGIGEILIRYEEIEKYTLSNPPRVDSDTMFALYNFASENSLPILIHNNIALNSDNQPRYLDEMNNALKYNRNVNIIWAHMGLTPSIKISNLLNIADALLFKNPNLYFDISWSVYDMYIAKDETSLTNWAKFIEKHSSKFMIGSDLNGKFQNYNNVITRYASLITRLSNDAAKKICSANIMSLMKKY